MIEGLNIEELEQMAVRSDWATWFETHGHIVDSDGELRGAIGKPLRANYLQRLISETIEWCEENELPVRLLILKPRQRGCSTFSTAGLYHALNSKPRKAGIIGAKMDQAQNLLGMVRTYSDRDGFDWGTSRTIKAESAEFLFEDGRGRSQIDLLSAKEYDPGRSGTYQFLLATEVARWSEKGVANAKEVLAGLLKGVQPNAGTVVIQETTAKGASGDYYRRWLSAMEPEEYKAADREGQLVSGRYIRIFAPWYAFEECRKDLTDRQCDELIRSLGKVARYNCAEFGDERNIMSRYELTLGQMAWRRWAIDEECDKDVRLFNQDYPTTWEGAFLTSGDRVFNATGLKRLEDLSVASRYEAGTLEWDQHEQYVTWRAGDGPDGMLHQWEAPQEGGRYLVCADVATGASQTTGSDPDRHSVWVLKAGGWQGSRGWVRPKTVMRIKPPCFWDLDILADMCRRMSRYYGGAVIIPEANNPGLALIENLKRYGAPMYRREVYSEVERKMLKQLGWLTTAATRPALLTALKRGIRDWEEPGQGFDILCEHAVGECRTMVRNARGKEEAMEGHHDDDPMALAIGFLLIDQATLYRAPVIRGVIPADLRGVEDEAGAAPNQYS
jgi:hypothetical protein